MDVTPDYSRYSLHELRDVAARINRDAFPERYALVLREIERHEINGEEIPNVPEREFTLACVPKVLLIMAGGTITGAVLGGSSFYIIFPPYISDYGDGIGAGSMILFLALIGAIIGSFVGLIGGIIFTRGKL